MSRIRGSRDPRTSAFLFCTRILPSVPWLAGCSGANNDELSVTLDSGRVDSGSVDGGDASALVNPLHAQPEVLDFGATVCGEQAAPLSFTLSNELSTSVEYTLAVESGPYHFAAGDNAGSLPANGSATVSLIADLVPKSPASLVASTLEGSISIRTTGVQTSALQVPIHQSARGAVISLSPAAAGATADAVPFLLQNTGNVELQFEATTQGLDFRAAPGSGLIGAGQEVTIVASHTAEASEPFEGSLQVTTATALCQEAAPPPYPLGSSPVASFAASLALSAVCGEPLPATADLTIRNLGQTPLTIANAVADSGFAVTSSLPLSIAPGGSAVLSVRPPAPVIGTDLAGTVKAGTLSFQTNEPGQPTRTVSLASAVSGANLRLVDSLGSPISTMESVGVGSETYCPPASNLNVVNLGNLGATMNPPTGNVLFGFSGYSSVPELAAAGQGQDQANAAFQLGPMGACEGVETVLFTATGPVCTAQPMVITASFDLTGPCTCINPFDPT